MELILGDGLVPLVGMPGQLWKQLPESDSKRCLGAERGWPILPGQP